jgi:lipopolysaccharide transport system ATP-binding protein
MSCDAIRVRNLGKRYQIYETPRDRLKQFVLPRMQKIAGQPPRQYFREFQALGDVSFDVRKGETVGIIGRNGSGKSTLLQIICGTLSPTFGAVETKGRIAALLELGSGFNPDFTGRENVFLNASVLGLSNEEIANRFDDIAAFADIGDFIDQPVKTYSSGMTVRLAFAVAISVDPDLLVVDEALAVGDAAFQRKCIRRIGELTDAGVTLLFVSHDTETVKRICSRSLYLKNGQMRLLGNAKDVCIEYERDLFGASRSTPASNTVAIPEPKKSKLSFDPELRVSAEKSYGDGRASIESIAIVDGSGEHVNVIPNGAEFVVAYAVKFIDTVTKPVFGMMVTTREGVCVFGTNTTDQESSNREFVANDELRISFKLTNNLGPGIYYLTCGIHSKDHPDGLVYIHRRMDAYLFRSLAPEDGPLSLGLAHLSPSIDVEEMT